MEPEAPAAVLAELQRVLEQACEALGCQEEGRLQEAVQVGGGRPVPGSTWAG